jgi:hypothetical protein
MDVRLKFPLLNHDSELRFMQSSEEARELPDATEN